MDANNNDGEIRNFYRGKSILITGSTGFMGKVLVHKLLSDCPIKKIYLLIRPKKGIAPVDRLNCILETPIFEDWKTKKPDKVAKLIPLNGDISKPKLGLSEDDYNTLVENVSIVFHSAATVRFDEPIEQALQMNLHGTIAMMQLARKMSKLEVFLHVSTAYAHCYMRTIKEKFYISDLHSDKNFWEMVLNSEEAKEELKIDDIDKYCNTYSCSKAMAESYISRNCQDIPVVIVRPSIVCASWKEPKPGWIDNFNGPTGMMAACQSGLMRTMHVGKEKVADLIPVDVVINCMIVAAWKRGKAESNNNFTSEPIPIYQSTSGNLNPITWGQIEEWALLSIRKFPLDSNTMVWYPGGSFKTSAWHDVISRVMFHYLPALLVDLVMILLWKRPFLMRISSKITKATAVLGQFTVKDWIWTNESMLKLRSELENTDEASLKAFDFELKSFDWKKYLDNYCLGTRHYLLKNKPETLDSSRKHLKRLKYLHYFVQCLFAFIIYWIFKCYI